MIARPVGLDGCLVGRVVQAPRLVPSKLSNMGLSWDQKRRRYRNQRHADQQKWWSRVISRHCESTGHMLSLRACGYPQPLHWTTSASQLNCNCEISLKFCLIHVSAWFVGKSTYQRESRKRRTRGVIVARKRMNKRVFETSRPETQVVWSVRCFPLLDISS
jgi:hypothetical protein